MRSELPETESQAHARLAGIGLACLLATGFVTIGVLQIAGVEWMKIIRPEPPEMNVAFAPDLTPSLSIAITPTPPPTNEPPTENRQKPEAGLSDPMGISVAAYLAWLQKMEFNKRVLIHQMFQITPDLRRTLQPRIAGVLEDAYGVDHLDESRFDLLAPEATYDVEVLPAQEWGRFIDDVEKYDVPFPCRTLHEGYVRHLKLLRDQLITGLKSQQAESKGKADTNGKESTDGQENTSGQESTNGPEEGMQAADSHRPAKLPGDTGVAAVDSLLSELCIQYQCPKMFEIAVDEK
jgi:hypothetical protein